MSSFAAATMERAPESTPVTAPHFDNFEFDPIVEQLPPNQFPGATGRRRKEYSEDFERSTANGRKPGTRAWDRENLVPLVWLAKDISEKAAEPEYVGRHRKESRWNRLSIRAKAVGAAAITAIGLFTVASPDVNESTRSEVVQSETNRADILGPTAAETHKDTDNKKPKATPNSDAAPKPAPEGVSFNESGMAFPLRITKKELAEGASANGYWEKWCNKSLDNCHHNYNAADIMAPEGTDVLAVVKGEVQRVGDTTVTIVSEDGRTVFFNQHLDGNSIEVEPGEIVEAGEKIAEVGDEKDAFGTPEHLHLDAMATAHLTPGEDGRYRRPACAGASCSDLPFIDIQELLVEAAEGLPEE